MADQDAPDKGFSYSVACGTSNNGEPIVVLEFNRDIRTIAMSPEAARELAKSLETAEKMVRRRQMAVHSAAVN